MGVISECLASLINTVDEKNKMQYVLNFVNWYTKFSLV